MCWIRGKHVKSEDRISGSWSVFPSPFSLLKVQGRCHSSFVYFLLLGWFSALDLVTAIPLSHELIMEGGDGDSFRIAD